MTPLPLSGSSDRPGIPARAQVTEEEVSQALRSGQIGPFYQSIAALRSGAVVAAEALARWLGPAGQPVRPEEFIGVAERSGLIVKLDLAVFGRAVLDLKRWQRTSPRVRLSMNLSGQFTNCPGWGDSIIAVVDGAGVEPEAIDLELTETTRPADLGSFGKELNQLRSRGFKIWLDDIGSDWHALGTMLQMQIDGVKMERAYASLLGTPEEEEIRAIAQEGAERHLGVTLEGIETLEQSVRARELGVGFGQGYFWSRPVPAATFVRLLAR